MVVLLVAVVTAKLTDYSNSNYIPVSDGYVTIWQDFEYLRHTTNLTLYSEVADDTERLKEHFPQSHMKKILDSDIGHVRTLITTIDVHRRHTRSIKFLGTALKVISGTPDYDDFEDVKFNQRELIQAENRQILINTRTQEKINNLTDTVNIIIKNTKAKMVDTEHLYETLLARNRIVVAELESLMLSITLSKIGIVNPQVLDSNDLLSINSKHSTNVTIQDLMEVASIRVLLDDKFLHFLIKYPRPDMVCKKVTLYPVQHNYTILNFNGENSVADCENQTLPIGNCNATLTTSFCRKLVHSTCAQQLHSGGHAYCTSRPSHLESVTIVDEGVVIVNDDTFTVKTNDDIETTITGTFLLTFSGEAKINETLYRNHKSIVTKLPESPIIALLNVTGHENILSLPYLQRLSAENLRHIEGLKNQVISGPLLSAATLLVLLTLAFCCFKFHYMLRKNRQQRALESAVERLKKSGDVLHLGEGGVSTTQNFNTDVEIHKSQQPSASAIYSTIAKE